MELKTTEAALAEVSTSSDDGSPEFEVEPILNHKVSEEKIHCFIKWKNYPEDQAAWESESKLSCHDIIANYIKRIEAKFADANRPGPSRVKFLNAIGHEEKEISYLVLYSDGTKHGLSSTEAKVNWPNELLELLESNCR